jgi:hypothetical protein
MERPVNHQLLDQHELDLGEANPKLLPIPPQSTFQHVAVQAGQDDRIRLINLENSSVALASVVVTTAEA